MELTVNPGPARPDVLKMLADRRCVWGGVAVLAAALLALNAAAPGTTWVGLTEDLVSAGAVVCLWIGARRHEPGARRGWLWLALALSCWVAGDLIWDGYAVVGRERPDVSYADALYLLGYPLMAIGMMRLARQRAADRLPRRIPRRPRIRCRRLDRLVAVPRAAIGTRRVQRPGGMRVGCLSPSRCPPRRRVRVGGAHARSPAKRHRAVAVLLGDHARRRRAVFRASPRLDKL